MDDNELLAISRTFTLFAAKQLAADMALQQLIQLLSTDAKKVFAERLRAQAATSMEDDYYHVDMDSPMTLAVAALLNAARLPRSG